MLTGAEWTTLEDDPDIQLTAIGGELLNLDPRLRVVAVRRYVHDKKAPPQGKAIAWDSCWRYQALVTSLDWEPLDVCRFYNDRTDCERIFEVAKQALGMNWLVSHDLTANSAAFFLRLLAYNADLLYQRHLDKRAEADAKPRLRMGLQSRQHRLYNSAGRWLREHNRWVLRVSRNDCIHRPWLYHAPALVIRTWAHQR
jgi:hypothetical protein